jgi:protein ImuA
MHADKIAALRASLTRAGFDLPERHARIALGHEGADACLTGGLVRGALHEVFAQPGHEASATGFAAGLAARCAGRKPLLWIRQDYSALEFGELAATGLLELGIDPSRILLLCAAHAEDALRAASDALGCGALGAVVIEIPGEPKLLDLVASRRLTLAAAASYVTAFLLRFGARPDASAAETRWMIRSCSSPPQEDDWGQPAYACELVRNRHGRTGHWVMEWSCDDGVFRESAADRSAVVSTAFDRPAAAPPQAEAGRAVA